MNGGEGTSNREGSYGRLTRIDFPKFSGDDVNGWLFIVQQFFLIDNVQEDQKLRFNSVFEDPMVEIKNLKQDGEVKVYQEQFEVLLNRLDLAESYSVSLFIVVLRVKLEAIDSKELEEKRAKGICFYCDQKYAPGHKCPGQLYSLEVSVDEEDQEKEICIDTEVKEDTQPLHILIDCGSTHNFLDTSAAKRFPCQLSATTPSRVGVANGSKMVSSFECKTFKWTLQGNEYEAYCMLLQLVGKKFVLRGSQKGSLQWIQRKQVITEGKWKQAQLASMIVCIYPAQLMQIQEKTARSFDDNLPLKQLLSTYEDVFAMPTALAPTRAYDHTITLFPNTPPVTIRPYRLPPNQKDVVEQIVKELLDADASETEHLQHLKAVMEVMRSHTLYEKQSKCIFLAPKVECLGHVLYAQGVAIDPFKIQAMASWPIPKTRKQLKEAEVAFIQLKQAMMSSPVLALPNFEKGFIVETDASGSGIGAVLHQEGHPIAYLSKALSPKHQALSTYEKCSELNDIIATTVTTDLLKRIQDSWTQDKYLHSLIQKFPVNPNTPSTFDWQSNQLTRMGKLVVGDVPELKDYLLNYVHATSIGGHSGVQVTLQNLNAMVYWKGYLQPLPIPPTIWSSISMDFIEGFPSSQGKTVIFVVIDRLNKYAHFMALRHPFTASTVAQVFMENVFKLYGFPHSIISDRDKVVKEVGQVAYQLALPATYQIHNVFHVSQLKKCTHPVEASGFFPAVDSEGLLLKTPATILGKVRNSLVMYVLVQWTGESVEYATWEIYDDLIARFPSFDQAF
uniref:Integrase catalytic domain-containing protein n=1 Tax=Tanacetum cinerariifolium TaxID=118510 RepID=A0A6L2M561_TANCI|nr:hypothetical protein [Tanacetum cinerariifolium]